MRIRVPILLLLGLLVSSLGFAQRTFESLPYSLEQKGQISDLPAPVLLSPPDLTRLQKEDAQSPGLPRFAAPVAADMGLANAGRWTTLANGDRIWQLRLRGEQALGLAFFYDTLQLPEGSMLHMYRPDGRQVLGAYRHNSFPANRRQFTGFIVGKEAVLEYYEPASVRGQGRIHLFRVDQAYDESLFGQSPEARMFGFGASSDCNVNANCPEGDGLADAKESICRIIVVVEEGTGYCSGSLVNNTAEDGKPYLLTAFHCMDGFTPLWDLWRFDFGFEGPDCSNPATQPDPISFTGCIPRSGWQASDFLLLELATPITSDFDLHFNGWNRADSVPEHVRSLHHPRGDIKKVSLDTNSVTIHPNAIDWNNGVITPPDHHFRTVYDAGFFEVGSSGGPLLDTAGLIVGQLNGGFPACTSSVAYFGRLAISWEGGGTADTRLRDWLDPENTGAVQLDGTENPIKTQGILAGTVRTPQGMGIAGVSIQLDGFGDTSLTTLSDGYFEFSGLTFGEAYTLSFSKDTNDINGVSTLDIILAQRHLLGLEPLDGPYKQLAADVNASGAITVSDFFRMRRVILGIDLSFPDKSSWEFIPADYSFSDMPLTDPYPTSITIAPLSDNLFDLDVVGVKTGDLNDSADPEE